MTVSANVAATPGQILSASSLFSASDVDGNTLSYYLYDANPSASSGHWVVNRTVVPSGLVYAVSAAQLAQTSFVAGAAGASDELRVIAYVARPIRATAPSPIFMSTLPASTATTRRS